MLHDPIAASEAESDREAEQERERHGQDQVHRLESSGVWLWLYWAVIAAFVVIGVLLVVAYVGARRRRAELLRERYARLRHR